MTSGIPLKKLFKTALYTSALIGALAIMPFVLIKSVSATELAMVLVFHALFIFLIWSVNIGLVFLSERKFKKYPVPLRYFLSYAFCVTIVFIKHTITDEPSGNFSLHHNSEAGFNQGKIHAIAIIGFALNTIVLIIQDLILLREKKARVELENAELKIKNIEATNQQLKQQIHPHFLFNSLTTLKSLIKKHPEKAEEYLIMLSDFLRASISTDTPNLVKLKEEIKLSLDYLEMQQVRFGEALKFKINISDNILENKYVPVFSVQQLVENAIKHNAFTDSHPLLINIDYDGGRIVTENSLRYKKSTEASTGLGLTNLKDRYKILSGEEIVISTTAEKFSVSIGTFDNEYCNHRR
jgi:sensor histidine kinase YesM